MRVFDCLSSVRDFLDALEAHGVTGCTVSRVGSTFCVEFEP